MSSERMMSLYDLYRVQKRQVIDKTAVSRYAYTRM